MIINLKGIYIKVMRECLGIIMNYRYYWSYISVMEITYRFMRMFSLLEHRLLRIIVKRICEIKRNNTHYLKVINCGYS